MNSKTVKALRKWRGLVAPHSTLREIKRVWNGIPKNLRNLKRAQLETEIIDRELK